jgi:hypothetical protein
MTLELSGVWTLLAALVTIELGKRMNRALPWIERGNIPPAVTAGLALSLVLAGLRAQGGLDVKFATAPRDTLLVSSPRSPGAHLAVRVRRKGAGDLPRDHPAVWAELAGSRWRRRSARPGDRALHGQRRVPRRPRHRDGLRTRRRAADRRRVQIGIGSAGPTRPRGPVADRRRGLATAARRRGTRRSSGRRAGCRRA